MKNDYNTMKTTKTKLMSDWKCNKNECSGDVNLFVPACECECEFSYWPINTKWTVVHSNGIKLRMSNECVCPAACNISIFKSLIDTKCGFNLHENY